MVDFIAAHCATIQSDARMRLSMCFAGSDIDPKFNYSTEQIKIKSINFIL